MRDTKLALAVNWLGDSVEAFGPSIYRLLAAVLPYSTPIPVAWLTMKSAEFLLQFDPWVSFVFVFGLEGIGIWFTGLFVEALVDYINSKNRKSFAMVLLFGLVVAGYIYILVNLNVVLKNAAGGANPSLSKVVTLLCFLPLMTGVGNGYYKLKLDKQRKEREHLEREQKLEDMNAQSKLSMKEAKLYLEHGIVPEGFQKLSDPNLTFQQVSNVSRKVSSGNGKVSEKVGKLVETFQSAGGDWRKICANLTEGEWRQIADLTPDEMREIANATGYSYKTISNWRGTAKTR